MWARVDDGWWCHPKVLGLDLATRGLWVSALSWSCAHRTDLVPYGLLVMLGASEEQAKALMDAGLWEDADGGWRIHDWEEYQTMTVSEKRAEAGRKGGQSGSRGKQTPSKRQANADEGGSETVADLQERQANAKQTPSKRVSKRQANGQAGTRPVPSRTQSQPQGQTPLLPDGSGTDDLGFDDFWSIYPRRNGKRVGKATTREKWRSLSIEHRREAWQAAKNYAAAVERGHTIAKDPERFLKSRYWQDWLDGVGSSDVNRPRSQQVSDFSQYGEGGLVTNP